MTKDTAAIRDQLGNDPDTFPVLIPDYDEEIGTEEGPTIIKTDYIGESWIVGSPTNGLVGPNTNTASGNQQVVGGSGRIQVIEQVQCPDNRYYENFRWTDFEATGSTTADWDNVTDYLLKMTSGEVAESTEIYKGSNRVVAARMIVTVDSGSASALTYKMGTSPADFETVENNIRFVFATPRTALYWRINASGTADISKIKIEYEFP